MEKNNKIVLIADYGRSGQGWLSYMLCYILNARFIEPYNFMQGKNYSSSERVLSLTGGNLPGREKSGYTMIVKTHNFPAKEVDLTDKVIFLTRDPRDVAVSARNWQRISGEKMAWNMIKGKTYLKLITSIRILSYIKTALGWKKYFNAWQNIPSYKVRYEELSSGARETLVKILFFLEAQAPLETINKAVEEFSFEKITGRKNGQEDKASAEFRKGVVGDYKNHFNSLELVIFRAICKKTAQKAGYVI